MTDPVKFKTPTIFDVNIADVIVDAAHNARTVMDADAVKDLAISMKREGQAQPVRVQSPGGTYAPGTNVSLVFGYRRFAAAMANNWTTIRAEVVEEMDPGERLVANLLENLGRENLSTYDQAMAFHQLQKVHGKSGTSIAHSVGKGVSYVNNLIRIAEGLHETVLARWRTECEPSFGRDPETGKKLSNVHSVCTSEWLGKLVARVPRAEQEYELKVALGLIPIDDGDEDGDDEGDGGGVKRETDAPRRATAKMLEKALKAAEQKSKEVKGEDQAAVKAVISTLKWAMGKSQIIKPIGYANPKPGEEAEKEKEKELSKKKG